MAIPNYSRVRLTTDRYKDEGASTGDVGSIFCVKQLELNEVADAKKWLQYGKTGVATSP
jgi:hypothetical protein